MEAAFHDSDDEDELYEDADEGRNTVMTRRNGGNAYQSLANDDPFPISSTSPLTSPTRSGGTAGTGTYDFENIADYDYTRPPPGSPPLPSSRALPNEHGNSNGLVPSPLTDSQLTRLTRAGERGLRGWFKRSARNILPLHYVERFGLDRELVGTNEDGIAGGNGRVVGGGNGNDGVFANVTAKPTRARRIQDGDETHLVPEDTSKDAPPSYASAQADSVPPYWETTIHAPSTSNIPGEMIIDQLQTGSLFSFLWNMLVSVAFQFVGFLLTYLLHTTHAAKFGSRAGLGITLIQTGFAMRSRSDAFSDIDSGSGGGGGGFGASSSVDEHASGWSWGPVVASPAKPSFETAAEAEEYYKNHNSTVPVTTSADATQNQTLVIGDVAAEWLSFFLMTVGWFLLLTSMLAFYRVKRWERSILSTQQAPPPAPTADASGNRGAFLSRVERTIGVRGLADGSFIRNGLVFPGMNERLQSMFDPHHLLDAQDHAHLHDEEDEVNEGTAANGDGELRGEFIIPIDPNDDERTNRITRAYVDEVRLQRDLRAAGLL